VENIMVEITLGWEIGESGLQFQAGANTHNHNHYVHKLSIPNLKIPSLKCSKIFRFKGLTLCHMWKIPYHETLLHAQNYILYKLPLGYM
jgi:hypothetical protein